MSSDDRLTDELLNGLIDEELTATEEADVRRRLGSDKQLAARLEQLTACRTLVSSLPRAKVPTDLAERVRQTLERRSLLEEAAPVGRGAMLANHLFARRLAAAAAAIGLVGVLSVLVYSILTPTVPERQIVAKNGVMRGARSTGTPGTNPGAMTARLEVQVASLTDMEMFFNRALENSGLVASVSADESNRRVYRLQCSHAALEALVADLSGAWSRFERPTFYLGGGPAGPVKVVEVTPDQLLRIASQQDAAQSTEVAKEIAVRNAATEALSGGKDLERLVGQGDDPWLTVPKPVLTSGEKAVEGRPELSAGPKPVDFTLVLDAGR
jgi:hypothetical protein